MTMLEFPELIRDCSSTHSESEHLCFLSVIPWVLAVRGCKGGPKRAQKGTCFPNKETRKASAFFYKHTIKVCIRCSWRCPGNSAPWRQKRIRWVFGLQRVLPCHLKKPLKSLRWRRGSCLDERKGLVFPLWGVIRFTLQANLWFFLLIWPPLAFDCLWLPCLRVRWRSKSTFIAWDRQTLSTFLYWKEKYKWQMDQ